MLTSGRAQATPESDFWKWFIANDAILFDFERDQEKIFDTVSEALGKVDPRLTFEFGPKENGRREFVISADGIRDAFPKVEALYAAAPAMPHWTVLKFRPRREAMDVSYADVSVAAKSVFVDLEPAGRKINLIFHVPGYAAAKRKAFFGITLLLLDGALGEYDVATKVVGVDVEPMLTAEAGLVPLAELPARFDALFAQLQKPLR